MLIGARSGAWAKSGAPLPYDAEVEYIESTGGCYVDTGFICDDSSGFRVDVLQKPGPNNSRIIGSYSGSNGRWAFVVRADTNYFYYGWNSASSNLFDSAVQNNKRYTASLNYLNSRRVEAGSFSANIVGTLNQPQNYTAALFGNNANGTVNLSECFVGLMFSAQITRGSEIVRDFVPVRYTNELGVSEGAMYDKVSGNLFRNAGTGAFVVGPDKREPVAIIEWVDGKTIENTGLVSHDGYSCCEAFIRIDATHTFKGDFKKPTSYRGLNFYRENKAFLDNRGMGYTDGIRTFTAPSGSSFVRIASVISDVRDLASLLDVTTGYYIFKDGEIYADVVE